MRTVPIEVVFPWKFDLSKPVYRQVASAFEVDVDATTERVICPPADIPIPEAGIVVITGPSGAGKTVVLNALKDALDVPDPPPLDSSIPVLELLADDFSAALRQASLLGLGEAFVLMRSAGELSEGQRYRVMLWWQLHHSSVVAVDDFCSVLDRTTAIATAYNFARLVRQQGALALVATTREDVIDDLNPDVWVRKEFFTAPTVECREVGDRRPCSLLGEMEIVADNGQAYQVLRHYHYRGHTDRFPGALHFGVYHNGLPVAAIVYGRTALSIRHRNKVLGDRYKDMHCRPNVAAISRELRRVMRAVVHPSYRGIGLVVHLKKRTQVLLGVPFVESWAPMGTYSRYMEASGFKRVYAPAPQRATRQLEALLGSLGFDFDLACSRKYAREFWDSLGAEDKDKVLFEAGRAWELVRRAKTSREGRAFNGVEDFAELCVRFLVGDPPYFIWHSEEWEKYAGRPIPDRMPLLADGG